jgi:ABC-type nitrate/sulfonate/bicarbonate transport system substrate-binding protein
MRKRIALTIALFLYSLGIVCIAPAQGASALTTLKVNLFVGVQNLPLYAAQQEGFFAKRGLIVEPVRTPNSTVQREGLANGAFDIVQSSVDNAIDMIDVGKKDVLIVAGGSDSLNELMVRPEVKSYDDLRGKTFVIDAPDTAYVFVLYKLLSVKGLQRSDYHTLPIGACTERMAAMQEDPSNRVAALFNSPCNRLLERSGFKSWGRVVDVIGPYQGDGTFVMRQWASAHSDFLINYLQSLIEGYRWASEPSNHDKAVAVLMKALNIDQNLAERAIESGVGPNGGLTPDLKFDPAAFRNVQQIRVDAIGGSINANIHRYYDSTFYDKAIAGLQ